MHRRNPETRHTGVAVSEIYQLRHDAFVVEIIVAMRVPAVERTLYFTFVIDRIILA